MNEQEMIMNEKIRKREKYWKICLNTVEHGYNDNY